MASQTSPRQWLSWVMQASLASNRVPHESSLIDLARIDLSVWNLKQAASVILIVLAILDIAGGNDIAVGFERRQ